MTTYHTTSYYIGVHCNTPHHATLHHNKNYFLQGKRQSRCLPGPTALPRGRNFEGSCAFSAASEIPVKPATQPRHKTQRAEAQRACTPRADRARALRRARKRDGGKQQLPCRILSATQRAISAGIAVRMHIGAGEITSHHTAPPENMSRDFSSHCVTSHYTALH